MKLTKEQIKVLENVFNFAIDYLSQEEMIINFDGKAEEWKLIDKEKEIEKITKVAEVVKAQIEVAKE